MRNTQVRTTHATGSTLLRGDHHSSHPLLHGRFGAVLGPDSQAIRGLYASGQFSDKVVFLPGVGQRLALMVQTVQSPVEFPQVLFWDKDVDMLAVVPNRFLVSTCR